MSIDDGIDYENAGELVTQFCDELLADILDGNFDAVRQNLGRYDDVIKRCTGKSFIDSVVEDAAVPVQVRQFLQNLMSKGENDLPEVYMKKVSDTFNSLLSEAPKPERKPQPQRQSKPKPKAQAPEEDKIDIPFSEKEAFTWVLNFVETRWFNSSSAPVVYNSEGQITDQFGDALDLYFNEGATMLSLYSAIWGDARDTFRFKD